MCWTEAPYFGEPLPVCLSFHLTKSLGQMMELLIKPELEVQCLILPSAGRAGSGRVAFSSPRARLGAQVSFWLYFYIPHLSGDMARFWTARSEE